MDDYDVVADALQKHRDRLWGMINRNMNSEYVPLNIMDDIRFYQIEKLDAAIAAHKKPTKILGPNLEKMLNSAGFYQKKEWVGLTGDEVNECAAGCHNGNSVQDAIRKAEAKLKEKNNG